jgi:hypothetical protein
MGLAPYVSMGSEQVYQQPFNCQNTLFYGMVLPADKAALQANVCDRMFNIPSGQPGRFVPAGPFVLLALCQLQKLDSETAPYSEWGGFTEQEVAFWVLTVDTENDQAFFAFPYIWVDNAYALSMGREIYGFPKELGRFQIPIDPKTADYFELDSLALKTLNPNTMGEWLNVLSVSKTGPGSIPGEVWNSMEDAAKEGMSLLDAIHNWGGEIRLLEHLFKDLITGTVPFAFLKQFRDVADGTKACYQSLIETNCRCTAWHGGGLLDGTYEVTMPPIGSMPIASDLGLGTSPIVPSIAFWCLFDFFIGNGQEIWKA